MLRQRHRAAFLRVLQDGARRLVKRETQDLGHIIRKELGSRSVPQLQREIEKFYERFGERIRQFLGPGIAGYGEAIWRTATEEVGGEVDVVQMERHVVMYLEALTGRHIGSSRAQLKDLIATAEDLESVMLRRLDDWEGTRADGIANREIVKAGGMFAKAAYLAAGVATIMWVAAGKNCPLCESLNGKTVSAREDFVDAGQTVDPKVEGTAPLTPRFTIGHPPLHDGCDCDIIAA